MRSYFAISGHEVFESAFGDCLIWARKKANVSHTRVVKILKARPGEKTAAVVAEITHDAERLIWAGRTLPSKNLRRAANG